MPGNFVPGLLEFINLVDVRPDRNATLHINLLPTFACLSTARLTKNNPVEMGFPSEFLEFCRQRICHSSHCGSMPFNAAKYIIETHESNQFAVK